MVTFVRRGNRPPPAQPGAAPAPSSDRKPGIAAIDAALAAFGRMRADAFDTSSASEADGLGRGLGQRHIEQHANWIDAQGNAGPVDIRHLLRCARKVGLRIAFGREKRATRRPPTASRSIGC